MTGEMLLDNLPALADAPGGTHALRGLIVRLAIDGQLLRDGSQRSAWRTSSIGDIAATMQPGFACSKRHQVDGGHVHLRTHNVDSLGRFNTELLVTIDPARVDQGKAALKAGDVLFNNTNSRELVGKSCVIPEDLPYAFSNHMTLLRPVREVDSRFLWVHLRAMWHSGHFERICNAWIGQAGINTKQLAALAIAFPPLAEQRRIVARVDELMALLDELERARDERDARRAAFRDSTLAALQNAEDAEAVRAAWSRVAAHMADLFTDPADIAPLRQTILQLAVRGRLVPQDPTDEPASALLQRVAAEQTRLVQRRQMLKPKAAGQPSASEVPYTAPPGWAWARLGSLLRLCRNGLSVTPNDDGDGYRLLRISSATGQPGSLVNLSDHRFAAVSLEQASDYRVSPRDLLACRFNGNLHYVGAVAQVPDHLDQQYLHPDKLIRMQAIEVDHRYLAIAINSDVGRRQVEGVAATTAGNIGINGKQMQGLALPIPPLVEQRRIVARVDELMAICDELEQRLAEAKAQQAAFAAAAVHHLDLRSTAATTGSEPVLVAAGAAVS